MGVVVYADDVLLLAPTRGAMQMMLDTCEKYAADHNILFSTDPNPIKSKTKCIFVCGAKTRLSRPAPLTLCGRDLPWVSTATHLGHELHESGTMDYDAVVKRATFIQQSVEIRETRLSCFNVKTKLLKVKISYFKLSKIILVRLVR